MRITHLEILVEEYSMEAFLLNALPRWLPEGTSFSIYTHRGKHDLLKKLPDRLLGYSNWLPDNYGIIVLLDKDNDDVFLLKEKMEQAFNEAGIITKKAAKDNTFAGISRIAIEELEAWYFGNWEAVRRVYPRLPLNIINNSAYRNCDSISGGTWEAFERICKSRGLFTAGLRKVEAAREIGRYVEIQENNSLSLAKFYTGLISLVGPR